MNVKRLKKKYYVPGLISAIFIPLMFWYYADSKLKEPIPNVMDIGLPAKIRNTNEIQYTFEPLRNWNYKKIVVKPNTAKENSKFYVSEIRKMQKRNIRKTGVEFILNDKNSYGDFASVINDFHIAKQDTYAVDIEKTGHIFATVNDVDPSAKLYECLLCNDVVMINYQPTFFEKITYQFTEFGKLPKRAYYFIFGFLIFLNISMLNIRKFIEIH